MERKVRINRIVKRTKVEGFGARYCIWVQGCSIRCPGCKNQHMWSFEGGKELEIESMIRDIKLQTGLEGITMMGGEPLDQKKSVAEILKIVKGIGLSTIVFTGYSYEGLVYKADTDIRQILKYTDLLIDGPFRQEEIDFSKPWIGSKNQRYLFLSDRYHETDLYGRKYENKFDVRIYPDGKIMVNGMGDLDAFRKILKFSVEE